MHISPRSLFLLVGLCFFVILSVSCNSDDSDDNPPPPSDASVWVVLDEDSVEMILDNLPTITVDGEAAIRLNEFVTTTFVPEYVDNDGNHFDARPLYGYRIAGTDGFSAHDDRGYPDNTWAHLNLGYMLVSIRRAIFPDDSVDLAGAYNVQDMKFIRLYRKFDVARPADVAPDSSGFVECCDVTAVTVTNPDGQPESALPLSAFVTRIVTAPESFHYNIVALDGFGPTTEMTWAEYQTGYWLLTSERTMFTDTALVGGRYRIRQLEQIQIVP